MRIDKDFILTINRATANGVDQCAGELFEAHGFQFCITNSFDEGKYYAIEWTTGISICSRFVCNYLKEQGCINAIKQWITKHPDDFTPSLVENGRELLAKNGLTYPLNVPLTEKDKAERKGVKKKNDIQKNGLNSAVNRKK